MDAGRSVSALLVCALVGVVALSWLAGAHAQNVQVYNLTVTWRLRNPDGYWRNILLVNNQMPGPTLRVTEGDVLVVRLTNHLPSSVISAHWHGLSMREFQYMDGAAMITQYPVGPQQSFEYRFNVTEQGTYWYHAHLPLQYVDGFLGALIVDRKVEPLRALYDEELVIILQDWYHVDGNMLTIPRDPPHHFLPFLLINGNGRTDCASENPHNNCDPVKPYSVINVQRGKRYRLRIVQAGARVSMTFGIANHTLNVVQVQAMDCKPFVVPELRIPMAFRYDVILDANQPIDNYWIRTQIIGCDACNGTINLQPNYGWQTFAILRYEGAPSAEPNATWDPQPAAQAPVFQYHDARIVPLQAPVIPAATHIWVCNITSTWYNDTGEPVALFRKWWFNGEMNHPPQIPFLYQVASGMSIPESGVAHTFPYGAVADIVINAMHNQDHPMHLHGYKVWLLGQGSGVYNSSMPLNTVNPQQLDTILMTGNSWAVFRFVADNPGVWVLHCHLDFHHAEEMAVIVLVAPERIPTPPLDKLPICDSYPALLPRLSQPVATVTPSPTLVPTPGDTDNGSGSSLVWIILAIVLVLAIGGALAAYFLIYRRSAYETIDSEEVPILRGS